MAAEGHLEAFHGLLTAMLSTENEQRSAAEKQYEEIPQAQKPTLLFQIYRLPGVAEEHRSLALVLLRRLLSSSWEEIVPHWGNENLAQFCNELISAAQTEASENVRKKLTDLISEVARNRIDDNTGAQTWGEIAQFIHHCSEADNVSLKQMALSIIEDVPNVLGNDTQSCVGGLKSLFEKCLQDASPAVRSSALKAYVSFIIECDDDDKTVKTLGTLAPIIIKVCEHVVNTEEEDDTPLQCLADLATSLPKVLQPHLSAVISLCSSTIQNKEKDESYRHSAMEVITSLCENASNMVKKRAANHIPEMLTCCLLMMTELEDDISEWLAVDDVEAEDVDEEETVAVGESSLDRIACALNGKVIVPIFLQIVNQLLHDDDWKKRHAGLMGLSTIGEGCQRTMEPTIADVVKTIVPYLNDPHPRVRYAACNALGQMSSDFAPTLQKRCHEVVVPALLNTLRETSIPRVSAHAGAALVNFSEDCPKHIISAYLDALMHALEGVLEATYQKLMTDGKKLILEQIITTIASVADASQELFVKFYDRLIGPLKFILKECPENFKILRGKTIECISLIGLAVGKDKFAKDAGEVMNALGPSMETLTPDDPQCSYFISSWTRICKVLGPAFAEYLPMVMPPIIRAAQYSPDVAVLDDDELPGDDPDWSFHPVGEKKNFGIRTSGIEEKATACEMIVCYARELKEAFVPYVEEISKLMIEHLKFFFHEGVRQSAAETFPYLLACVKTQGGVPAMRSLWVEYWKHLKDAIKQEVETEVTSEFINAVGECIEELGAEGLTEEELKEIGQMMGDEMSSYESRRVEREEAEADEDADPEEAREELDEEAEIESGILARISDVIHAGFKTIGAPFFHVVDPLMPHFFPLIDVRRSYTDRQWGICVLDDLVEFAPEFALKYHAQLSQLLLQSLGDEFPEVRQAAAYGFGAMALNNHPSWHPIAFAALPALSSMINRTDARSTEESTVATENAISSVAKIIRNCSNGQNVDQVLSSFVHWLPVTEDVEESVHVYGFLADLLELQNPHIIGDNGSNCPKILNILVKAIHNDVFEKKDEALAVKQRLVLIVKSMKVNDEVFMQLLNNAHLDDAEKVTLQNILNC
ncbi:hypothetical protein PFISCL1PPCAC_24149 [Pristionchus fissidentatus]|uniref:Importin N-terminal domain-containing protein n=1 Tax=Pristionchus fissidentatus TaxID=1538716 RepID=A0AAV5WP98_9BILA|nr:hypothetical protein PFISCL1PPCAC_24149 [Pristionchus fissidentatus]